MSLIPRHINEGVTSVEAITTMKMTNLALLACNVRVIKATFIYNYLKLNILHASLADSMISMYVNC